MNLGRPRILLVSIPHAEYRPILQDPFEAAVASARRGVADLMASQLAENIRHQGYSHSGRLEAIIGQMEAASARGEYKQEGPGLSRGRALRTEANRLLDAMAKRR